jgi:hypothetical protein
VVISRGYFDEDAIVDEIARREESELDAMVSFYLDASSQDVQPAPASPGRWSDDEDYDQLFMDIALSQDPSQTDPPLQEMDMS